MLTFCRRSTAPPQSHLSMISPFLSFLSKEEDEFDAAVRRWREIRESA
jgi:hypothetical protein